MNTTATTHTPAKIEAAGDVLRDTLAPGMTVAVVITGRNRDANGNTRTTLALLALTGDDSYPVNISGLAARVTGNRVVPAQMGSGVRMSGTFGGDPAAAARTAVGELARALFGASTALRSHLY